MARMLAKFLGYAIIDVESYCDLIRTGFKVSD